jgi:hypothetical protein
MTVSSLTIKNEGAGNGSQTSFSFSPVVISTSTDLKVVHVSAAGVETELSEGAGSSAYSVSVSSYPGTGTVTYPADEVAPMATGERIIMHREVQLLQPTRLRNQAPYDPAVLMAQLYSIVWMVQQLDERLDRVPIAKISEDGVADFELPSPSAGKAIVWNSSGDGFDNSTQSVDDIAQAVAEAEASATAAAASEAAAETAEANAEAAEDGAETAQAVAEAAAAEIDGLTWEGPYSAGTTYETNNMVSDDGYSYISLQDSNQGNTPAYNGGAGTAFWGVIAAKGAAGAGSGDLLAANNLSDVGSAATSFANIKQNASASVTGVVELATTAEVVTGTDTTRAVTAAGVQAALHGGTITRTAAVNMADQELQRAFLVDFAKKVTAHGNMGTSETFDFADSNSHTGTLSANLGTITLSNPPATGREGRIDLYFTQDGSTAFTVTWPGSVVWSDGEAPDFSTLSSVTHVVLVTLDAGATYFGYRAGGNFA